MDVPEPQLVQTCVCLFVCVCVCVCFCGCLVCTYFASHSNCIHICNQLVYMSAIKLYTYLYIYDIRIQVVYFPEPQLVAVYMCVSASVSMSVSCVCVCVRLCLYFKESWMSLNLTLWRRVCEREGV